MRKRVRDKFDRFDFGSSLNRRSVIQRSMQRPEIRDKQQERHLYWRV